MRNIAEEMLDILPDDDSWTQEEFFAPYTLSGIPRKAYCLLGAYGMLTHEDPLYYSGGRVPRNAYCARLAQVIREQYPERILRLGKSGTRAGGDLSVREVITWFNDHDETTYEDIRAVLEKTR
jgi:hypothetical protein